MAIIVDGDGCAGRGIIEEVAKMYNIPLKIYCDIHHVITSEYGEVIVMDSGFQAVDMRVANEAKKGDIVVTQDYGLAAMVLSKGGCPINQNGRIYNNENIDQLLFTRHISKKARAAGCRTKGPKKRQKEDDIKFEENLINLCKNLIIN